MVVNIELLKIQEIYYSCGDRQGRKEEWGRRDKKVVRGGLLCPVLGKQSKTCKEHFDEILIIPNSKSDILKMYICNQLLLHEIYLYFYAPL